MTPTDTDRRLAEIVARQVTPTSIFVHAREDIAFLLSLVEGLSRELLVAKAPSVIRGALADVIAERAAQDRKWGEQNHRDACPALLDRDGGVSAQRLADDLEIPSAARARANCQAEFARGQGNWASILVEEVAEAVAAIGEDADLRRELVQVSAVSLAWIEAIDRRSVGAPLVAASGASSAEGSIPSLPCPSPLSSPTPPAPEAAPVPDLSSGATGSEGGLAIHLEMRPEEEIDLASLAMPPLKEIDPADVSRMRDALSRMRTCPDCTGRATHAGACLTCAGTGFVGLP